jgi:hypothetical protein
METARLKRAVPFHTDRSLLAVFRGLACCGSGTSANNGSGGCACGASNGSANDGTSNSTGNCTDDSTGSHASDVLTEVA